MAIICQGFLAESDLKALANGTNQDGTNQLWALIRLRLGPGERPWVRLPSFSFLG